MVNIVVAEAIFVFKNNQIIYLDLIRMHLDYSPGVLKIPLNPSAGS